MFCLFAFLLVDWISNEPWTFSVDERAAGQEGAKEIGPPKFVTQVASKVEISEGQSAHFEARLTPTEDPNMKVIYQIEYWKK